MSGAPRGGITALLRRPVVIAGLAAGLVAAVLLAVFVFEIQTLFIDEAVDEAPPVFAAGGAPSGIAGDEMTADTARAMNEAMADGNVPLDKPVAEQQPMAQTGVTTAFKGTFMSRSHPTRGTAVVLTDGTQRVLRLEDFETDNGPVLAVYLSAAAADAPAGEFDDDFVDLGPLKGNVGAQNYEIPADTDLGRYRTVVIWCVRFSVAFGSTTLQAA